LTSYECPITAYTVSPHNAFQKYLSLAAVDRRNLENVSPQYISTLSSVYAAQVNPTCPDNIKFDDVDHFSEHDKAADTLPMETGESLRARTSSGSCNEHAITQQLVLSECESTHGIENTVLYDNSTALARLYE
jgi:hypothetical protein